MNLNKVGLILKILDTMFKMSISNLPECVH